MLTVSEAAALLRSFDRVLILTHIRPDGDTVGCAAGLCAALRTMGKTAYLLPNPGLTENTAPYFTPYSAPADFVPEKVVSTDIATVGLFPDNAKSYADKVDLAIDHHPSFEGFGKANIVRPEAAACGELILDIVRELTPLTPEIALPLYVAISTDTGGFIYSNVTAATHRAAALTTAPSTSCSSRRNPACGCSWRPPCWQRQNFMTATGQRCCPSPGRCWKNSTPRRAMRRTSPL